MKLYLIDNFIIQIGRCTPFLKNCKSQIISFVSFCRRKCLQIFKEDIAFFSAIYQTIKRDWKHSLLMLIIFIFLSSALLFYRNGKVLLATMLFIPGFAIYFVVLWQTMRKVKRKTKAKTLIPHDFNPISLGTLHFSVALSLWSDWATNKMSDDRTLVIAIIFSAISVIFFIAVYNKPTLDFMNTQAAPYIISLSFWALLAGFILGLFEALPDFPQTLFVNRVIVSIAVYFGFAWVVTFLLTMLRDAGNDLIRILVLVFLVFVGVTEVIQKDAVGKIGGIALFSIFLIGYLVSAHRIPVYGEVYEK